MDLYNSELQRVHCTCCQYVILERQSLLKSYLGKLSVGKKKDRKGSDQNLEMGLILRSPRISIRVFIPCFAVYCRVISYEGKQNAGYT